MSITRAQYNSARVDARLATSTIETNTKTAARIQNLISQNQSLGVNTAALEKQLSDINSQTSAAQEKLTAANKVVSEFENQPTIPSASETVTKEKYEKSETVAVTQSTQTQESKEEIPSRPETNDIGRAKQVPTGAIPASPKPASVNFKGLTDDNVNADMRVKIRVPDSYFTDLTNGPLNALKNLKGIIFPYTPQISIEHKADYTSQSPTHSNYAIYFYKNSSVAPINITGKFTVQDEYEAKVYIATLHLLRALTKMRSGGVTGDPDSGAPPPVCRLDAYGTFMLQNVPVAITSFKIDLPDNVDYYTVGKTTSSGGSREYEMTAVPVMSSISVTCLPMYSRAEMQKFNVTQWLGEKYVRKSGYL